MKQRKMKIIECAPFRMVRAINFKAAITRRMAGVKMVMTRKVDIEPDNSLSSDSLNINRRITHRNVFSGSTRMQSVRLSITIYDIAIS